MPNYHRSPFYLFYSKFAKLQLVFVAICCFAGGCQWHSDSLNSEGVRLQQAGQYDAALSYFNRAINSDHENADSYYNLGATVYAKGKRGDGIVNYQAQAENYFYQALERNPNHLPTHRTMAVLYIEQGKPEKAFKLMEDWSLKNPTSSEPKVELARLHEEFGDVAAAKTILIDSIKIDQNNPRAFAALASLQENNGNQQQALSNYRRAQRLNSNQPGVAQKIATLQRNVLTTPGALTPAGTRIVTQPSDTTFRR